MIKRVYAGLFLLLVFTYCTIMKTFKNTADLHGAVYDVKNRPVPGCTILLNGNEKAITDVNGRFILYGLKSGVYDIETNSSYCEKYTAELKFLNETQYVLISLVDNETLYDFVEEALGKKEYGKADKIIERLFTINKNNSNAIMYLAVIRYSEGNANAALRILTDAKNRGISDPWMKAFKDMLEENNEEN